MYPRRLEVGKIRYVERAISSKACLENLDERLALFFLETGFQDNFSKLKIFQ